MPWLSSSVASSVVAFVLLALFLGVEPYTRKSATARSLSRGAFDHGSTLLIGSAFGVSIIVLLLTLALNARHVGLLPAGVWLGWAGIVVMLLALALRLWATQTVGQFFTRTLLVTQDQQVVEQGPYRVIRHPGYLADIPLWIGAAVATRNAFARVAMALMMFIAYGYRIQVEEAMLRTTLGERYSAYMAHTWRLIPLIY